MAEKKKETKKKTPVKAKAKPKVKAPVKSAKKAPAAKKPAQKAALKPAPKQSKQNTTAKKSASVKKPAPAKKPAVKKAAPKKPTVKPAVAKKAATKKVAPKKAVPVKKLPTQPPTPIPKETPALHSPRVEEAVKKAAMPIGEDKPAEMPFVAPTLSVKSPPSPVAAPSAPFLSVIVPVFNEEEIVEDSARDLVLGLRGMGRSFEVILAENGSCDETASVISRLAKELPEIKMINIPEPNYGKALKQGILLAKGEIAICDEIDLCDLDFHQRALKIIEEEGIDFVIGSKLAEGSQDKRPLFRHIASHVITGMLRVTTGFRGTDTHGLKAFRRERLLPVIDQCIVENDLFASELVIRAQREGVSLREVPVTVEEKRPPSVLLVKRVPKVLSNLVKLTGAIRFGKKF